MKAANQKSKTWVYMFVSIFLFCFTMTGFSQSLGDVDNNGETDIVDALLVAQYYVGLNIPGFISEVADVDCSGEIDIVDALLVAQYYVGLVSELSCGSVTPSTQQAIIMPTPVNLSLLATSSVYTSSQYSNTYSKEKAVDGDINTVWGSGINDAKPYIYIDLRKKCELTKVVIKWYGKYYANSFILGVSNDLQNWLTSSPIQGAPGDLT